MASPTPPVPQAPDAEPDRSQNLGLITRQQEKEVLQGLNDRLSVYINKMQNLERENGVLRHQISQRGEGFRREVSGLKAVYEAKLAENRQMLDETSRERAKLQINVHKIRVDHDQLLDR